MSVSAPPSKYKNLQRLVELERRIEKRQCENYRDFFRSAWYELEPVTPLRHNWHIDVLCDELQKQAERIAAGRKKEYDIIINIPPGSSKSTIVRRLFIPWVWTRFPGQKFITASFDKGLSLDHAVDSRTVILSAWYQRHWGEVVRLRFDQNVKGYFKTDQAGFCLATSVTSATIGRRCDWTIIDDPNDPKKDESADLRMAVVNWFTKTIYKRLNNALVGQRVIVQQRTHENDLTGYLLANYPTDFKLFCIPGEETDDVSPPELRKHYVNGMFDPVNYSRETLEDDKRKLGSEYAGQILQRPAPASGGMFKKHWWKFWKPAGGPPLRDIVVRVDQEMHTCPTVDLPKSFENKVISWDMGLKGKSTNDPSAGHVWGKAGAGFYLLDRSWGRWNDIELEQEARRLKARHPDTSLTIIEDMAAGPVVVRRLQLDTSGVRGENPKGSKRNRARNLAYLASCGNVYLPHPDIAPWVEDVIDQFTVFDAGDLDDDIDAGSQAVNHLLLSKRVLDIYTGEVRRFTVAWHELSVESRPMIVQHMERNGTSALLLCLYNTMTGIVRVLADGCCRSSNPEAVMLVVKRMIEISGAKLLGLKRFQWYGSDLMFAKGAGDVAETYFMKRIYVQDVPSYNEPGAIQRLTQRFAEGRVILHERAGNLRQDLLSWGYTDDKDAKNTEDKPEKGFPLARALTLAAEIAASAVGIPTMPKKHVPYSKERTMFLEKLSQVADEAQLTVIKP